jgi:hypothetical protein
VTRWGQNGTGTIQAYSIGTISCNIGTVPLQWNGTTNQRPVIGMNLFRLKNGRFEHTGQSWLKWSFTALAQNLCGQCINPGTGSLLGVNCSDPYSASLNGSQSRLGPKSVVNAFTGYFPASHTSPGSGTIDGRLQALTVDVDPNQNADALYFIEGQYVSPDDATANNLMNNASWRRIWFSGLSMSLTGPGSISDWTSRTEPAIFAWKEHDPAVGIVPVNVPGEGRGYVGWRAYQLDADSWRYEFAVQNLNSHLSFGSFKVLFDNDPSVVTSTSFHDVPYHSGEPYVGTDWPATVDATGVMWACESYALNQNANALRWGTLYNFGFIADIAPEFITMVQFETFRPGGPGAFLVDLPTPGSNDSCYRPRTVLAGTHTYSAMSLTSDGPAEACGFGGGEGDVWFRFEPACSGTATFSTCGSDYDTILAIYPDGCPGAANTAIGCNDDSCGVQSSVTVNVLQGAAYLVRIGGKAGAIGLGKLTISCTDNSSLVPNNICADAIEVEAGVTIFDNTNAATEGPLEPSCSGQNWNSGNDRDVWFKYVAVCTGSLDIRLCASLFNNKIAVYAGACPTGSGAVIACNDNKCDNNAQVTFACVAGQTYYIRVGGNTGATGIGRLQIECTGTASACPNDTEASATIVSALPYVDSSSTTLCTNDYDAFCPWGNSDSPDSVYEFTPKEDVTVNINVCSADFDTKLAVYVDRVTGALLDCNDDGCPGAPPEAFRSRIENLPLTGGTRYRIVIDGYGGQSGNYTLDIRESFRLGDMDCDGDVDFFDIDPFVLALSGETAYLSEYPECNWLSADCDEDNDVDFFDIDLFVALIGS